MTKPNISITKPNVSIYDIIENLVETKYSDCDLDSAIYYLREYAEKKKIANQILAREYLSKCKCCDECFAELYCIENYLKSSRVPQDYCIENICMYLEDRGNNEIN